MGIIEDPKIFYDFILDPPSFLMIMVYLNHDKGVNENIGEIFGIFEKHLGVILGP